MSELAKTAEQTLNELADLRQVRLCVPKNPRFSRADVVSAFQSAFELIGGTPRLALWANDNPTEFYKLFGKLLPSATQVELVSRPRDPSNLRTYSREELMAIIAGEEDSNIVDITDFRECDEVVAPVDEKQEVESE